MLPGATVIDVSQHQGVIDWQRVASKGVLGAYVRATMGVAGFDARLIDNAWAGDYLPTGFYHLLRPEHEGAQQAQHFLDALLLYQLPTLPYAVDVELDGSDVQKPQTPERIAHVLRDFILKMEQITGAKPVIYTGAWFWNPKVGGQHDALFAQCPLWIAEYGTDSPRLPRGFETYWLHQYTSSGTIDGITGRVDMNRVAGKTEFKLMYPVDNPRVTQVYGARPEYYAQFGLPGHEGIDYGGADGTPIYAAAGGTIKLVAKDNGVHPYGNHIRITHSHNGDVYETIYAHLRGFKSELKAGDAVSAGAVIGYMGSTGNSTGTHLHFTLKKNGGIVNPAPYFE